jgi:hypothetical protein
MMQASRVARADYVTFHRRASGYNDPIAGYKRFFEHSLETFPRYSRSAGQRLLQSDGDRCPSRDNQGSRSWC